MKLVGPDLGAAAADGELAAADFARDGYSEQSRHPIRNCYVISTDELAAADFAVADADANKKITFDEFWAMYKT